MSSDCTDSEKSSDGTDPKKVRLELAKSFTTKDVSGIMDHFYRLSGALGRAAREISTDPKKVRLELRKSMPAKDVDEMMDHFYRLSDERAAREGSTDSEEVRRELSKSLPTEGVKAVMTHVRWCARIPKKTARESGFYQAMAHGVSNHVHWDAWDLKSLIEAVPKGSIGRPIVKDPTEVYHQDPTKVWHRGRSRIPKYVSDNNVRIVDFGHLRRRIDDEDLLYLQRNQQFLSKLKLSFTARDVAQLKMLENLTNLRNLSAWGRKRSSAPVTLQCRWRNMVELELSGCFVLDISWEIPPVFLETLSLTNMCRIGGLEWLPRCGALRSININCCAEVCCESLVLPDSVEHVGIYSYMNNISGIKHLEFGRSARTILVEGCSALESIDLRKAHSAKIIRLRSLEKLARIEYYHDMPKLDAESIHDLQNGGRRQWRIEWTRWLNRFDLNLDEDGSDYTDTRSPAYSGSTPASPSHSPASPQYSDVPHSRKDDDSADEI